MNPMLKAKFRTMKRIKAREDEIISQGYDSIALQFPGRSLRTKEQYEQRLTECTACCPSGFCEECGCNYKVKLILKAFICGKGKFRND